MCEKDFRPLLQKNIDIIFFGLRLQNVLDGRQRKTFHSRSLQLKPKNILEIQQQGLPHQSVKNALLRKPFNCYLLREHLLITHWYIKMFRNSSTSFAKCSKRDCLIEEDSNFILVFQSHLTVTR